MKARPAAWLAGASASPLFVLTGLNLVDEFDRIAFTALSPEIRDAFSLGDTQILALNVVPAIMILLFAGPIGRLTDRFSRVHVSLAAALMWGTCAALTALVPTVGLLLLVRTFAGIGRTANEIVHPSLLADLYPPQTHPRVFLLHRLGNPLAQGSGVMAGFLAATFGWTWAFYLLALPTFALAIALTRLRDPGRRGVPDTGPRRLGKRETFRELVQLRSLRRFWAVAFFLSIAAFGMFALASLYFEQVWGFDAKGRGFVQFVIGVGWIAGVAIGGRAADRRLRSGRLEELANICGNAFLLFAIGGVLMAVAPTSWFALAAMVVLATGNGVWQAPYYSTVGRIAPPGLSGQAFASAVLAYALGGLGSLAIGALASATNYRTGFLFVAGAGAIAALLARSVTPLARADLERADLERAHDDAGPGTGTTAV